MENIEIGDTVITIDGHKQVVINVDNDIITVANNIGDYLGCIKYHKRLLFDSKLYNISKNYIKKSVESTLNYEKSEIPIINALILINEFKNKYNIEQ